MSENKPENEPKNEEDEVTQSVPEKELEGDNVTSLQAKIKETEDKYLRTYADFENYKKRAAKDREDLVIHTSEKLLKELIEVKDHLELALTHAHDSPEVKNLREGVNLTLKQMNKFLEKFGVKEFSSLGESFDPSLHEAILQEESVEYQAGVVVREFQKGYLFNGRLLRPARVAVSSLKQ